MDKRFFIFVFLLILSQVVHAQTLRELLDKGDRFFSRKNYNEAVKFYNDAVNLNPEDAEANFKLGLCYLSTDYKTKSLDHLLKAYRTKPEVDLDIDYHLGLAYQFNHRYGEAIKHFEAFKKANKKLSDIANHKITECVVGDSLIQHPTYVVVENAGPVINSKFHEYSPIVSADGSSLIFTSNRPEDEKVKSGMMFEDIFLSRKNGNEWDKPQKISPSINIKYHDAAASLSPDGKTLFLYYEEGAGDIYTSTLENGEWTTPQPLNRNINTPLYWETSISITADGKRLFFSSNRPGGHGELDIYVSELDASGNWGKAVNLGPKINTPGNEDSPYIHPDGQTLYFSSDGHPSMGSNDIFKSEFMKGSWSNPVNLGYPVNSIEYDGFFSISHDRKTGYYSTIREDGYGDADVYFVKFLDPPPKIEKAPVLASTEPVSTPPVTSEAVPMPEKTEPYLDPMIAIQKDMKIVTVLKGKVIDEETGQPLHGTISLMDNENNRLVAKLNADPVTGDFELIIPHGGNYGVSTEHTGYLFNSINFNVPQFAEYQEIDMHIIMVKAVVGSKVTLKNIFFDVGKSDLKNESLAELEKIRELLETNEHLKVQINGHTDNRGNAVLNKTLSLKRAEAVVKYLIDKGVGSSRLSAKGFGAERPLVSNDDEEEGRAINRRTEIEITSADQ